jgi:hypothetical protein
MRTRINRHLKQQITNIFPTSKRTVSRFLIGDYCDVYVICYSLPGVFRTFGSNSILFIIADYIYLFSPFLVKWYDGFVVTKPLFIHVY